jgi:CubicO group peptidase (beta-lactamase class C family)
MLMLIPGLLGGVARADDEPSRTYRYAVPEKTDDGWEAASLAEAGLDPALIQELFERIGDETYKNIHSVVVVRDGRLVIDAYFRGINGAGEKQDFERDTLHSLQSVTKSVNALLVGIAIDQKLIGGIEEPLAGFFPDDAHLFATDAKKAIRLRHCLAMTPGLAWVESGIPYTNPRNEAFQMNRSPDPVRFVLEKPVANEPGRRFVYNSGISIVLGEVVRVASGLPADEFARKHLFAPLGISEYRWGKLADGTVHTGGGLWLKPRDMAKLGLLMLDGGRWRGKPVVSEAWVRESLKQQAPYQGYGYQWWLRSFRGRDRAIDAFAAQGLGGQFIIVIPDLRLVAAFTGWNPDERGAQPLEMLQRYILPATGSL